jgi:cytochrome b6-f complex iron-sulfur subunit
MMDKKHATPSDDPSRRRFVKVCIGGCGAVSAGAVGYPVVSFLGQPIDVSGSAIIEIPITDLHPDQARYLDRKGQAIVVIYTQQQPKVFSAACSHLGCLVAWDNVRHIFRCPCHGAVFDDEGRAVIKEEKIVIT